MQQKNQPNTGRLVPLSSYDVTELKLENGQLAMHGLGGVLPISQAKPTWGRADTLESIVHQATCNKREIHHDQTVQTPANILSMVASSAGTWTDGGQVLLAGGWMRKRTRSDFDYHGNNFSGSTTGNVHEEHADPSTTCVSPSASASARARLCRDNETTVATRASFESPPSLKSTKSTDEDSACHGGLENKDVRPDTTKDGESGRSRLTTPRRAAAVHNRERRDRINQKMKALQRLVPNASKTDKASLLDEVIKYLEQLQAQVQMMSSVKNMPHMNMNMMNMPLEMLQQQQQLLYQMSVLAHMGMAGINPMGLGMGVGMLDMNNNMACMAAHHHQSLPPHIHPSPVVATALTFIPPFMVPHLMPPHPTAHQIKPDPAGTNNASEFRPFA